MKINTRTYENSHGRKPSQTIKAAWWFEVTVELPDGTSITEDIPKFGELNQAAREAKKFSKEFGKAKDGGKIIAVEVLP